MGLLMDPDFLISALSVTWKLSWNHCGKTVAGNWKIEFGYKKT